MKHLYKTAFESTINFQLKNILAKQEMFLSNGKLHVTFQMLSQLQSSQQEEAL